MTEAASWFQRIDHLEPDQTVVDTWSPRLGGADAPEALEVMTRDLGAVAVGCAEVEEAFVYSHKGRFDDNYGRTIPIASTWAVVFLVEMDFDAMQRAPHGPTIIESARQYCRAAEIALNVTAALEAAGHRATAHYDAHYEVILPPLAVAAGLGELGRNNILVADRFGSRVRIGAVTTDLALESAEPRSLGVRAFCERCKKCSDNCPTGSLSKGDPIEVRGVTKWPTRVEKCFAHWRRIGTDCGICMAVCPFSHRNSWFHNLVRRLVRHHPAVVPLALLGDDLVFGRRWKSLLDGARRTGRNSTGFSEPERSPERSPSKAEKSS